MLYRPKFCAECGEKIERAEWHLWTSGRFCELCDSGRKGSEMLARFTVAAGVFCVFGFVVLNFVAPNSSKATPLVPLRQAVDNSPGRLIRPAENHAAMPPTATPSVNVAPVGNAESPTAALRAQPAIPRVVDAVYMCGAATKKGTPCSRRVREKVRCWQHTGMPAMVPDDKLRVN